MPPDSKKPKNANKNEYVNRVRTAEQCWLIANMESLVNRRRQDDETFLKKNIMKHSLHKYHIALPYSTEFARIMGKFFIGPHADVLFDLKTYELSALVPKMNLYRVDIDRSTGKVKSTEEFYFDSHISSQNVQSLITGNTERFGEAGVIGVNWELLGGQPAEVKRYVQVDIEFFFSSVARLTQEDTKERLSYLDLFRRRGGQVGDPYRLRLDVGWHLPEKNMALFENEQRAEQVRKAIDTTSQTLWLNLRNHDLKFNQNGTVNLTINYISSLEYDLSKVKVIQDTRKGKDIEKQKKDDKKAQEIFKQFTTVDCRPKNTAWKITQAFGGQDKNLKAYIEAEKAMRAKIEWNKKKNKGLGIRFLSQFNVKLHELISIKKGKDTIDRSRIFNVSVPTAELGFTSGEVKGTIQDKTTVKRNIQKSINIGNYGTMKAARSGTSIEPQPVYSFKTQKNLLKQASTNSTASGKRSKKAYLDSIKKLKDQLFVKGADAKVEVQGKGTMTPSTRRILNNRTNTAVKYMFLGDIVDTVLDVCKDLYGPTDKSLNSIVNNMKIVFGVIELPTFGSDGTPKPYKISLADLPISYNLFNAWFIKNVVDTGRTQFLLKDFIRTMLIQLVNASVGNNCFTGDNDFFKNYPRNRVEISFHTVKVAKQGNIAKELFTQESAETPLSKLPFGKKRITKQQLESMKFKSPDPDDTNVTVINYLFINTINEAMHKRKKNRVKDFEEGIFHLNIAQDDGIVKEITFNKAQADYLEESLLTDQKRKNSLEVFRRVYDVSVSCYGNASFLPGQMIYVDPTTVGMGDPAREVSVARQLGLGGYFVITKVTNSIKRGEFLTNFTARWVGFGDGKPSVGPRKKKIKKCKNKEAWKQLVIEFKKIDGYDF